MPSQNTKYGPPMKNLILFVCLACPLIAFASEVGSSSVSFPSKITFGPRAQSVNVKPIAPLISSSGESLTAFLLRAGTIFRGFTAGSGLEACSAICRSTSGQYGLFIVTNESHVGCAVIDLCPSGMSVTGESIHSHPQFKTFTVNRADKAFIEARSDNGAIIQSGSTQLGSAAYGFSETDYEGGPGYLVDGDVLRYQKGSGTSRNVGVITPVE
jgi:hypothetical protein